MAREEVQVELDKLSSRESFLAATLKSLATKSGLEAEYRRKFGLAREGEGVAIIVDKKVDDNILPFAPTPIEKIKDFFLWLFEK